MTKIAKNYGLTFKEMVRLVIIKSEIKRDQKFENGNGVQLINGFNPSIEGRELACYESLCDKGFISDCLSKLTGKGLDFPFDMGAISFIGGCYDEDVLDRIKATSTLCLKLPS